MKPNRCFLCMLLAVLLLAGSISGCADPAASADVENAEPAVIDVHIVYPARLDLSRETEFVGRVESGTSVNVFAEVPAKILNTYKTIGEHVNEGELLMEVDDTDMQNALLGAQSAAATANLTMQQTQATQNISNSGSAYLTKQLTNGKTLDNALDDYYIKLNDAKKASKKAQDTYNSDGIAALAEAEKLFTQYETVFIAGNITHTNFMDFVKGEINSPHMELTINNALNGHSDLSEKVYTQRVNYTRAASTVASAASTEAQAKAALEAYEKQYDTSASTIDSSIRSITKNYDYYAKTQALNGIALATIELSCANAQRAVETAQKNVDKCKIHAPVSGTITAKNAVASNFASAAAPMYVIAADNAAPVIAFNVSEDGADALHVGSPLTVIANGENYSAQITEISNSTSAGSGLYAAKASLPVNAGLERTGMVVKVRAATAEAKNVLTLPLDNIQYDENQPFVLVYRDGTAVRCDLELGMSTRTDVEIVSGVTVSDAVITTWHPELRNGSLVNCAALQSTAAPSNTESIEVIE